ncbi:MAG: hypothetical protein KDD21_08510 [Bacteroidetes bacterium]|nr:hypothetical protein [Bacteroidota bacterium]
MSSFVFYAYFNSQYLEQIPIVRNKHLEFVKENKDRIRYGGVIHNPDQSYKGILIILEANTMEEATDFIKNDPYFKLYNSYKIDYFIQKIPPITI